MTMPSPSTTNFSSLCLRLARNFTSEIVFGYTRQNSPFSGRDSNVTILMSLFGTLKWATGFRTNVAFAFSVSGLMSARTQHEFSARCKKNRQIIFQSSADTSITVCDTVGFRAITLRSIEILPPIPLLLFPESRPNACRMILFARSISAQLRITGMQSVA